MKKDSSAACLANAPHLSVVPATTNGQRKLLPDLLVLATERLYRFSIRFPLSEKLPGVGSEVAVKQLHNAKGVINSFLEKCQKFAALSMPISHCSARIYDGCDLIPLDKRRRGKGARMSAAMLGILCEGLFEPDPSDAVGYARRHVLLPKPIETLARELASFFKMQGKNMLITLDTESGCTAWTVMFQ